MLGSYISRTSRCTLTLKEIEYLLIVILLALFSKPEKEYKYLSLSKYLNPRSMIAHCLDNGDRQTSYFNYFVWIQGVKCMIIIILFNTF